MCDGEKCSGSDGVPFGRYDGGKGEGEGEGEGRRV